jgi:hypothetical protein
LLQNKAKLPVSNMSNKPLDFVEIRRQLHEMMKETDTIEKAWAKQEKHRKKIPNKDKLRYEIKGKDWDSFKSSLTSIDSSYKHVISQIDSIAKLAALHPEGMESLPIDKYSELCTMRLEAMMFDTSEVLKLLAINTYKIVGEQTLSCAYAIQRLQDQVVYLEKMVDEVADKVDVDLSDIKEKMNTLKTTLDSEEVSLIGTFVKDTNKKIEEYKKKMAENDLAT